MKITNTSKANQGVWAADGTLVQIEPGQTREVEVAEDYAERVKELPFLKVDGGPLDHDKDGEKGGAAEASVVAPADFDPELIDAMTDDELRGFITQRDGKAPHPNTGHDKLLAKARGED